MTAPADSSGPDLDFRSGWVALPRALRNHPIMRKGAALALFIWILTRVRYKPGVVDLANGSVTLQIGECAYGQREVADALALGRQALRGAEAYLERHRLIARKSTQAGTVVTVLEFEKYRDTERDDQPTGNPPATHEQPSVNPGPTHEQPLSRRERLERGEEGKNDKTIPPTPQGGEAQASLVLVPVSGDAPKRTRRKRSSEPTPEEWPRVERILGKLTERTGVTFSPRNHKGEPTSHVAHVLRRLREEYTEHDLRLVLWHLDQEWDEEKNPDMRRHLNPETVFGRKKFETYVAQARAAWAAAEREDEVREHQRRKSAPVSPIVASLLEGGALPFEHVRKPEPKRDVRFGRVEPLPAEEYNRIAAEGSDL